MHDDGFFDERVAARYDESSAEAFDAAEVDPAVDLLAEDGPVLELGIGTGRIALPLARRGVAVHGIELSRAMVARLRATPGGVLRVWATPWHEERTVPALRALLELDFEHVLVSHGEPVHDRAAFEAALEREPWSQWTGA